MRYGLQWTLRAALFCWLFVAAGANAGQLLLRNEANAPITCTVDGWTVQTGFQFDWQITVQPNRTFYVGQNTARAGTPVINWADCGGLATRAMNITPTGPDGILVFNGQQTRVLNVALYPYIPTLPGDRFEALVAHVVATYQQQNPQVLLAAQMNQETNIYSFAGLRQLLGPQGLDVIELDTLYIGFLADAELVNPAAIAGEAPLPVAIAASTHGGQLWGVPSWLCMDFVYSGDPAVQQATSLAALLAFLGQVPPGQPEMVGDYNGSWRLPSIYINAYVQAYGYGAIGRSMQMPPDPAVIANLVSLTDTCANAGANNCTNGTYHGSPNGTTERVFATGHAGADIGFSEQSFFVNLYGPVDPLYAAAAAWGATPQPLLFSDSFVTSRATCAAGSQCAADAAALTTLMTGLDMKNYIVESQDLARGSPWRTLLVAQQDFYGQPQIRQNPMYQQYVPVFATAQPFPNAFTAELQTQMGFAVCRALQAQRPAYACNPGPGAGERGAAAAAAAAPEPDAPARSLEEVG